MKIKLLSITILSVMVFSAIFAEIGGIFLVQYVQPEEISNNGTVDGRNDGIIGSGEENNLGRQKRKLMQNELTARSDGERGIIKDLSGKENVESIPIELYNGGPSRANGSVPDAPTLDPIDSPNTNGTIFLNWTAVDYADNYTIYRHTSLITEINQSVTVVNTTTYTNYTDVLSEDGTFYYSVIATNATGDSALSNCQSVVVDLPGPEAPVLDPLPSNQYSLKVNLTWSGSPNADSFTIYRSEVYITEINSSVEEIDTTSSYSYMDIAPKAGHYYYVVVANNATGQSNISNCVDIEIYSIEGPTMFDPVVADPNTNGSVSLSWSPVQNATSYEIYFSDHIFNETGSDVILAGKTDKTAYNATLFSPGTFYYAVRAILEDEITPTNFSNNVEAETTIYDFGQHSSIGHGKSVYVNEFIYDDAWHCYYDQRTHSVSVEVSFERYSSTKVRMSWDFSSTSGASQSYHSQYWTYYIYVETAEGYSKSSSSSSGSFIIPDSYYYYISSSATYYYFAYTSYCSCSDYDPCYTTKSVDLLSKDINLLKVPKPEIVSWKYDYGDKSDDILYLDIYLPNNWTIPYGGDYYVHIFYEESGSVVEKSMELYQDYLNGTRQYMINGYNLPESGSFNCYVTVSMGEQELAGSSSIITIIRNTDNTNDQSDSSNEDDDYWNSESSSEDVDILTIGIIVVIIGIVAAGIYDLKKVNRKSFYDAGI